MADKMEVKRQDYIFIESHNMGKKTHRKQMQICCCVPVCNLFKKRHTDRNAFMSIPALLE